MACLSTVLTANKISHQTETAKKNLKHLFAQLCLERNQSIPDVTCLIKVCFDTQY